MLALVVRRSLTGDEDHVGDFLRGVAKAGRSPRLSVSMDMAHIMEGVALIVC
jgi:hypothetical protein